MIATDTAGPPTDPRDGAASTARTARRLGRRKPRVQNIAVARIRPEDGLGRKRDRAGHRELCRSIEQFGVLTPVTVRVAPDGTGDYLLIKGQGRTLACQVLGLKKIPAVVVDNGYAESAKVQQFLVENVARLRMRPIDRALLIARARAQGEETADVARRFGVTPSTVRRLEAQLDGATKHEVAALKMGSVNLAVHGVIAKHVDITERGDVVDVVAKFSLKTKEAEAIFTSLGWKDLVEVGPDYRSDRLVLLAWACSALADPKAEAVADQVMYLAETLPLTLNAIRLTPRAVGTR